MRRPASFRGVVSRLSVASFLLTIALGALVAVFAGCDDATSGGFTSLLGDAGVDAARFADAAARIIGQVEAGGGPVDAGPDGAVDAGPKTYFVGGAVTGLKDGTSIVLQLNGSDDLSVAADGPFVFSTKVPTGEAYDVTIKTQPTGATCTVSAGSGTIDAATIANVVVNCAADHYTLGGTVSGLAPGALLRVTNNGTDDMILTSNGAFALPTTYTFGTAYSLEVAAQPISPVQVCTVASGSGTFGTADVTTVQIACTTTTFTVGGKVSGLAPGATVVLRNNGADDLSVTSNGAFTFAVPVASGANYAVTIVTNPASPVQVCTVAGAAGAVGAGAVTSVDVTCATSTFTVGGALSGLGAPGSLVLTNNGGDALTLGANGAFTFASPVASGSAYAIAVQSQPAGQTCAVGGASGTVTTGPITSVNVTCAPNTYTVGGSVSGLDGTITISNGADSVIVSTDGPFTLPAGLTSGTGYLVSTSSPSSPVSQSCSVENPSGTIAGANVTNVAVACSTNSFTVSGVIEGLFYFESAVVRLNGNPLDVYGSEGQGGVAFTFPDPIASGQSYTVTVDSPTQEIGQICVVSQGGSGTMGAADVDDVVVECTYDEGQAR